MNIAYMKCETSESNQVANELFELLEWYSRDLFARAYDQFSEGNWDWVDARIAADVADAVKLNALSLARFPNRLASELAEFNKVAAQLRESLRPARSFELRCVQVLELACDLFANAPTWVCFYRELFGGNGLINELFGDRNEYGLLLQTEQYHEIQLMLTALRSRDLPESDPSDPARMITVRLPKSLHDAICDEANRLNVSINRLVISRMLQPIDPELIPEAPKRHRTRLRKS